MIGANAPTVDGRQMEGEPGQWACSPAVLGRNAMPEPIALKQIAQKAAARMQRFFDACGKKDK